MGKSRTLADTVSTGGPLADGVIGISDVTGLQAALDAKSSLVSGTAITTNGASSYEFTGIPASAKSIKLLLRGVSTTGAFNGWLRVELGTAANYVTSGYVSTVMALSGTAVTNSFDTAGFIGAFSVGDAELYSGIFDLAEVSANAWTLSGQVKATTTRMCFSAGDVSLGAELTRIRFSIQNSGTFDAGTINILYE